MVNTVLNNRIGGPNDLFNPPQPSKQEERIMIAELFEQLMLFDRVVISTSRTNYGLYFLIKNLGINTVERLLERDYLRIMLFSPVIMTSTGHQNEDGTINELAVYGQKPLFAGTISENDLDPEKNVFNALSNFRDLNRERKRIITRIATKNYIIPDGMQYASESADFVIDAYCSNNLETLGLPYNKAPEQLNVEERGKLLDLGYKLLETSILAKYSLKSFENYEHFKIGTKSFENIGKAFNIQRNAETLLDFENTPNLRELFLQENLSFDQLFKLRHLPEAKYFRKWINQQGETSDSREVTAAYLNAIKGKNNFFATTGGKFLRNLGVFGLGTAIGKFLQPGTELVSGYALGLLDTYILENFLKGNSPSFFIDSLKAELKANAQ